MFRDLGWHSCFLYTEHVWADRRNINTVIAVYEAIYWWKKHVWNQMKNAVELVAITSVVSHLSWSSFVWFGACLVGRAGLALTSVYWYGCGCGCFTSFLRCLLTPRGRRWFSLYCCVCMEWSSPFYSQIDYCSRSNDARCSVDGMFAGGSEVSVKGVSSYHSTLKCQR